MTKESKNTKTYTDENGKKFHFDYLSLSETITELSISSGKHISDILQEIASKLFLSFDTVKKWKYGENAPADLQKVKDIAEVLGVDPFEFLSPLEKGTVLKKYSKSNDSEIVRTIFEKCIDIVYDYVDARDVEAADKCRENVILLHKTVDEEALFTTYTTRYKLHKFLIEFYHAVDYPFLPKRWLDITHRTANDKWNPFQTTYYSNILSGEFETLLEQVECIDNEISLAERLGYFDNVTIPEDLRKKAWDYYKKARDDSDDNDFDEISKQLSKCGHPLDYETEFRITPEIVWEDMMVETLREVFMNDFADIMEV